jgi:hypothetical protein
MDPAKIENMHHQKGFEHSNPLLLFENYPGIEIAGSGCWELTASISRSKLSSLSTFG